MTISLPAFPVEGGCACGAVRYRLAEEPIEFHVCHCTDCQSATGTAFALSMVIRRSALEQLQGDPQPGDFENAEGVRKRNWFCSSCRSRLWGEPRGFPDLLVLRPGTLDDTGWLRPTSHIWTASAQPWVVVPDDVLRFERQPEDPMELVREWRRQRGPAARSAATPKA